MYERLSQLLWISVKKVNSLEVGEQKWSSWNDGFPTYQNEWYIRVGRKNYLFLLLEVES